LNFDQIGNVDVGADLRKILPIEHSVDSRTQHRYAPPTVIATRQTPVPSNGCPSVRTCPGFDRFT
jgi:hypothetical protein